MSIVQKNKDPILNNSNGIQKNMSPLYETKEYCFEDKFPHLFNLIPTAIIYVDKNHQLLYANAAFKKMFNWHLNAVEVEPLINILGQQAYETSRQWMDAALAGEEINFEMEVSLKDGSSYIETNFRPDFDINGNVMGIAGTMNDITQKKQAGKKLTVKNEELQDYVDNASIALHWVDSDGIILWANEAELKMLGYTEQEYFGQPIAKFHADKDKIDYILSHLANDEVIQDYEACLKHKDGSDFTVLINSSVLRENGKFVHTRCFTTNINDRKLLEDSLQKSKDRYQLLMENLPAALYTCDIDGKITLYNQAAADLWGRHPELGKDLWCGSLKIFHPDGFTALPVESNPMALTLKKGQAIKGKEIVIERPDGKRINVQAYPVPLVDKTGKVLGAVNMLMDISDRIIAENKLAHLAAIVHSSSDPIIGITLNGIVTSWNEAAERVFGYSMDEMVGESLFKIIPDELLEEEYLIFERLKKGEMVTHMETKRRTKDHTILDISGTISPIKNNDGYVIGASKILRDITAQKVQDEALRVSEDKLAHLAAIVHSSSDPIIGITLNGIVTSWNEAAERVFGFSTDEMVGETLFKIIPEDLLEEEYQIFERLKKGEMVTHMETKRCTKDQRILDISGTISPIKNNEGYVIGASKILRDITAQKAQDEALRESEERLRMASESVKLGTWEYFPAKKQMIWSEEASKIFGVSNDFVVSREFILQHIHPDDLEFVYAEVTKTLMPEGNGVFQLLTRIYRASDKEMRWVKIRGKAYLNEQGYPERFMGNMLDITEEKQAEQLIRESEERLRMAIQTTRLGTWEYFPLTGKLDWSEECKIIYDAPLDLEVDFNFFTKHIHPDDAGFARVAISHAMNPDSDGNYDIQYRILRYSDLEPRWIRTKGKVYFNLNRQPERFIGTVLDITEEKIQEQELKNSVELFTSMADNVPAMIWMSGDGNSADFFNKTWLEFTGRTIEQEKNEGWVQNVHPDDAEKCLNDYRESYKNQVGFYTEYRLRRHDGEYRWIADNSVPRHNRDGNFAGFISACMDMDDQKNFSEKIQESELKLKTISNASPVGLWMTDTNAQCTFVNDTWIKWTGIPFDQQMGNGWLMKVLEEDKVNTPPTFREYMLKRENYHAEFRITRADGQLRWCLTEGAPYYDIDGAFAGYAGSVTDITDIRKMEERKDDFIKMASHELKTPITSIKGYIHLLLNIYDDANEEKFGMTKPMVKSSLNTIAKQVSKLTRLVSELLDLSRIESGKLELNKTSFNLEELVEETAQEAHHTSTRHKISIHHFFKGNIFADKDRISQVLLNLLTNAIKYSPYEDNIEITVEGYENYVSIKVKDHGIGINKKDHQMIFQRFYRVEGKSEQTYPGFGIGLFICNEIIQRHNGSIFVESNVDKGSVFTITLPIGL